MGMLKFLMPPNSMLRHTSLEVSANDDFVKFVPSPSSPLPELQCIGQQVPQDGFPLESQIDETVPEKVGLFPDYGQINTIHSVSQSYPDIQCSSVSIVSLPIAKQLLPEIQPLSVGRVVNKASTDVLGVADIRFEV
jgi:hypothetical protein